MWTAIFYAVIAATCVGCAIACAYAVKTVNQRTESLLRRINSIELQLESQGTSLQSWQTLTEELAQTVKMQRVRKGIGSTNARTDLTVKDQLRLQAGLRAGAVPKHQ
jgi:hypothetical protein